MNNFNLKKYLAEGKLLKEQESSDFSAYLKDALNKSGVMDKAKSIIDNAWKLLEPSSGWDEWIETGLRDRFELDGVGDYDEDLDKEFYDSWINVYGPGSLAIDFNQNEKIKPIWNELTKLGQEFSNEYFKGTSYEKEASENNKTKNVRGFFNNLIKTSGAEFLVPYDYEYYEKQQNTSSSSPSYTIPPLDRTEGKLYETINLDIEDDIATLSGDSGEYEGEIEDGKASFSVIYDDLDYRITDQYDESNIVDFLGKSHAFVELAKKYDYNWDIEPNLVGITIKINNPEDNLRDYWSEWAAGEVEVGNENVIDAGGINADFGKVSNQTMNTFKDYVKAVKALNANSKELRNDIAGAVSSITFSDGGFEDYEYDVLTADQFSKIQNLIPYS